MRQVNLLIINREEERIELNHELNKTKKMKAKINFNANSCQTWFSNNLTFKSIALIALVWFNFQTPVQAQETATVTYTKPSWFFGVAGELILIFIGVQLVN